MNNLYESLVRAWSGNTNVEPERAIYIRALLKPEWTNLYKSLVRARSGNTNVGPERAIYMRPLLKPEVAICMRALLEPGVAMVTLSQNEQNCKGLAEARN